MKYYLQKDQSGNDISLFEFDYLFVKFIFEMEKREIQLESGTKIGNLTLMKFDVNETVSGKPF